MKEAIKESEKKEVMRNKDWPDFVEYDERTFPTVKPMVQQARYLQEKFGLAQAEANDIITYKNYLDFTFPELVDKKILDIGSGMGGFKQGLMKMGYRARNIVSLTRIYNRVSKEQKLDIQGLAEFLPLKDESFDIAVANCSVPVMAASDGDFEIIPQIFKEMMRVVKRSGELKVYPVGGYNAEFDDRTNKSGARLTQIMRRELEKLHKEQPGTKIKISKVLFGGDSQNYGYALSVWK